MLLLRVRSICKSVSHTPRKMRLRSSLEACAVVICTTPSRAKLTLTPMVCRCYYSTTTPTQATWPRSRLPNDCGAAHGTPCRTQHDESCACRVGHGVITTNGGVVGYDSSKCQQVASALSLDIGGHGFSFQGNYNRGGGCYSYQDRGGSYAGTA